MKEIEVKNSYCLGIIAFDLTCLNPLIFPVSPKSAEQEPGMCLIKVYLYPCSKGEGGILFYPCHFMFYEYEDFLYSLNLREKKFVTLFCLFTVGTLLVDFGSYISCSFYLI